MSDLVGFLRGCLEQDEQQARMVLDRARFNLDLLEEHRLRLLGRMVPGWNDWPDVERLCLFSLAEIKAKRAILDLHAGDHECSVRDEQGDIDNCHWVAAEENCTTVLLLAQSHADQPGWSEEWAVSG